MQQTMAMAVAMAAMTTACAPEGSCADDMDCAFGRICGVEGRCGIASRNMAPGAFVDDVAGGGLVVHFPPGCSARPGPHDAGQVDVCDGRGRRHPKSRST
jgi:hypothetical protein